MFQRIIKTLWGQLSKEEFNKFAMLSLTFFFTIGTYWLMKPLKDSIFIKTTGKLYLPYARMASLIFIIPLVLLYSELVDLFEKQKLFYIICAFYAITFIIIAYLLAHPTIGLLNTVQGPTRFLGWFTYLIIESFGSIVVALFWSFVTSNTTTDAAKRGYSLIICGAQTGTLIGPFMATHASLLGMPLLAIMVACGVSLIPVFIKIFIHLYPATAETSIEKIKKTGPIEGLKLLLSKKYLLGILGVATLYFIIGTILEYQMIFLADEVYHTAEKVTEFMGFFGLATNSLALLFSLIGTSYFLRTFGLTFCLVAYPITIGIVLFNVWAFSSLWIIFAAMVAIKGLSYALNNPCKEILYIPTSRDVKFKSKGWIDMFGTRLANATGSYVNTFFTVAGDLLFYGSLISLGIVGFWIFVAWYVGRANQKLIENNQIVE